MNPGKIKILNRAMTREKLRSAVPIVGMFCLIAGLFSYWTFLNETAVRTQMTGEVITWSRSQTKFGSGALILEVRLKDGEIISAIGDSQANNPRVSQNISITRLSWNTGRVRYDWNNFVQMPPAEAETNVDTFR